MTYLEAGASGDSAVISKSWPSWKHKKRSLSGRWLQPTILRAEIGVPNVKVFEQTTRSEALSEQIDQAAELDEHRKGRPRPHRYRGRHSLVGASRRRMPRVLHGAIFLGRRRQRCARGASGARSRALILAPEVRPQQDFFIADIFDAASKDEIGSMEFPLLRAPVR